MFAIALKPPNDDFPYVSSNNLLLGKNTEATRQRSNKN